MISPFLYMLDLNHPSVDRHVYTCLLDLIQKKHPTLFTDEQLYFSWGGKLTCVLLYCAYPEGVCGALLNTAAVMESIPLQDILFAPHSNPHKILHEMLHLFCRELSFIVTFCHSFNSTYIPFRAFFRPLGSFFWPSMLLPGCLSGLRI